MQIELFGVPRLLAGSGLIEVRGRCLRGILRDAVARHPGLRDAILDAEGEWLNNGYVFVVDGKFVSDPEHPARPESEILLVSKASGG